MGRTNGKLKSFLRDGLQNNSFYNLKWEDEDSQIFSLKLPRYEKRKDLDEYEKILIEWYEINNNIRKYPGYSGAKAVIQAALKKSVYLRILNNNSNELRLRFATKEEEQEKRRKQKDSNLIVRDPVQETSHMNLVSIKPELPLSYGFDVESLTSLSSPNQHIPLSPTPSNSSGYQSGSEDFIDENIAESEESNLSEDPDLLHVLDDIFQNPDNFIETLADVSKNLDILANDILENIANVRQDDLKVDDAESMQPNPVAESMQSIPVHFPEQPVVELVATEVNSSQMLSTYWLCTRKVYVDSTLLLICEKQVIRDQNQGIIRPGHIDLNGVLEPGKSYSLEKMFELDGKCFLFFITK